MEDTYRNVHTVSKSREMQTIFLVIHLVKYVPVRNRWAVVSIQHSQCALHLLKFWATLQNVRHPGCLTDGAAQINSLEIRTAFIPS